MAMRDVILIPGGGVREGGEVPPWVKNRLNRVLEIQSGEIIITLSGGTVHRPPPLDQGGFPIFESVAGAGYLIKKGIKPDRVFVEINSYDTIGNAFFSRVIHVEPAKFRNLLIVTSEFHMPRTESIFRWVYGLDVPPGEFNLNFESVSDEDIPEKVLLARKEREKESLARFEKNRQKIFSLKQLHHWLFTEHAAYSMSRAPDRQEGDIIESY